MNLQVAFCYSSDIILDRVRSVSSSREVSVRQALTKPSHHLEYDHPDMEQVRIWARSCEKDHQVHPRLICKFDQVCLSSRRAAPSGLGRRTCRTILTTPSALFPDLVALGLSAPAACCSICARACLAVRRGHRQNIDLWLMEAIGYIPSVLVDTHGTTRHRVSFGTQFTCVPHGQGSCPN